MPIISIIVPVYNVASYLPRCIESLLAQTFMNLEILLIDDGSTDESSQICDKYALEDTRIQVIHQRNQGVSHARNIGIETATGSYITFVDSDDWVSSEYIELLYKALQKHSEASISFCEHFIVKDGKEIVNYSFPATRTYDIDTALYHLSQDKKIKNYIWGKLFRKELFNTIRFPEDRSMCEDMAILYQLFYLSGQIIHIPAPAYYYLVRANSSINAGDNPQKAYQYFLAFYEMCMFIREKNLLPDGKIKKRGERRLVRRGIHLLHRCIRAKNTPAYTNIIQDTINKLHTLDNISFNVIGLEYYLRRKLVYTQFPLYSRFYLFFRRKR